jgi:hypothetical protein
MSIDDCLRWSREVSRYVLFFLGSAGIPWNLEDCVTPSEEQRSLTTNALSRVHHFAAKMCINVKSVNDQLKSSLRGNSKGFEVFTWFETSLVFIGACRAVVKHFLCS